MTALLAALPVFAAVDPLQYVLGLAAKITNLIFNLGLIAAVIVLVWVGFRYIMSGTLGEVADMHKTLGYLLLGLAILFVASAVPRIVCKFLISDCRL